MFCQRKLSFYWRDSGRNPMKFPACGYTASYARWMKCSLQCNRMHLIYHTKILNKAFSVVVRLQYYALVVGWAGQSGQLTGDDRSQTLCDLIHQLCWIFFGCLSNRSEAYTSGSEMLKIVPVRTISPYASRYSSVDKASKVADSSAPSKSICPNDAHVPFKATVSCCTDFSSDTSIPEIKSVCFGNRNIISLGLFCSLAVADSFYFINAGILYSIKKIIGQPGMRRFRVRVWQKWSL